MVGKKLDESGFISNYISQKASLSVQCLFLYKVEEPNLIKIVCKKSIAFNSGAYEAERFYKPIHIYHDRRKANE